MASRIVYIPRDEKRRRPGKKPRLKAIFGSGAAVLSLAGVSWALLNPAWQIAAIEVSGNETLASAEIKHSLLGTIAGNYAVVFPRQSFFLASATSIESALVRDFPKIKRVEVKKIFPDRMSVVVEERSLWGIACNDLLQKEVTDCVYVDTTGFSTEHSPASRGSLILKIKTDNYDMRPGIQILAPALVETMLSIGRGVKDIVGSDVVAFEVPLKIAGELRAETREGFKIFFDLDRDIEPQFKVLKTVLEKEIKERRPLLLYIDLRFGNKVFFKLK